MGKNIINVDWSKYFLGVRANESTRSMYDPDILYLVRGSLGLGERCVKVQENLCVVKLFACRQIMSEPRKVLVALDGSKHSQYALDWFLNKCLRSGDTLIGYSAWQSPHLPTFSLKTPFQPPVDEWQKLLTDIRKQIDKIGGDFDATCQGKKTPNGEKIPHSFFDESINPGEGICAAAEKHKADLIVMGTRGLSTLRRTVLGSVSDYVLHHTHCPVAVVPMPEEPAAKSC